MHQIPEHGHLVAVERQLLVRCPGGSTRQCAFGGHDLPPDSRSLHDTHPPAYPQPPPAKRSCGPDPGADEGKPFEDKGQVVIFEPEREMAYSHFSPMAGKPDSPENYHLVDITLEEDGRDTNVTLEQSNVTGGVTDDDRANRTSYDRNWQRVLDGLRATVES
ncbi:MAG: SRPBCC family protein [Acidimicrobiia bacterium]